VNKNVLGAKLKPGECLAEGFDQFLRPLRFY